MVTQPAGDTTRPDLPAVARRPWWSRVSTGQLLMVIAAIAAFLLNLNLLRARDEVSLVAVAVDELTPGQVFEPSAVEYVEIDAANPMLGQLLTNDQVPALEGQIVVTRVEAGVPVSRSFLGDPAADGTLRAMSIPVEPEHAVGGRLITEGDVVDVIAVVDGRARYVVTGAEVLGVTGAGDATGLAAVQQGFSIIVAVDAPTALAIAEALEADSLEVIRATGAPVPELLELPQPAAESSDDGAVAEEGEVAPPVEPTESAAPTTQGS